MTNLWQDAKEELQKYKQYPHARMVGTEGQPDEIPSKE
jgi:hypothetical protein